MAANRHGIGLTSQRARDRLAAQLKGMGVSAEPVLDLIRSVPRHLFVDEALASRAYENTALPIGFGQTISQPYIVATMTELLWNSGPLDRVLEIGAGCGYQTALLAGLCGTVFSIERISGLAARLEERLTGLDLRNVVLRHGDGSLGWSEEAPFDAILVAAAGATVPDALLAQLTMGGRLVMPIGKAGAQTLMMWRRTPDGLAEQPIQKVSFVPLIEGVA